MEPIETKTETTQAERTPDVTKEGMALRIRQIRHWLKVGLGRKEICARLEITPRQYQCAMANLGKFGTNNAEAFGDFLMGEQNRLEEIEEKIKELFCGNHVMEFGDKLNAYVKLQRLAFDIKNGVYEMGMKLGVLDREAIKIENRSVEVGFGDEEVKPWFSKQMPAKTEAGAVN